MGQELRVLVIHSDRRFANHLGFRLYEKRKHIVEIINDRHGIDREMDIFNPHVVILGEYYPAGDSGVNDILPQLRSYLPPPEVVMVFMRRDINYESIIKARDNGAFSSINQNKCLFDDWIFNEVELAYCRRIGQ